MANFTCDICGGTIKMQGSQGGVCQTCGMEYDIEAIRAKVNAPQQSAPQPAMVQSIPQNNQQGAIDRQALLIHLNDLRTMETIIHESYETEKSIDNNQKSKRVKEQLDTANQACQKTEISIRNCEKRINTGFGFSYKSYKTALIITFLFMSIFAALMCYNLKQHFTPIQEPSIWNNYVRKEEPTEINDLYIGAFSASAFIFIIFIIANIKKRKKEMKKYIEKSKMEYVHLSERKKEVDIQRENAEKSYNKWIDSINVQKKDVIDERTYIIELLTDAYNANIIPLQFRTIEGVYYLYDYLSTSNQTLAEALLQANLETIKQRLEQVIESQGKLIVEQQQTNAKLANIQQTNQQILETAKQTAANTAQAAQYAQIAATNTELLTKLNKKQLAYQRADFWLK